MQIENKVHKYLDGSNLKVGVVVARWNSEITDELLASAKTALKNSKVVDENIKIVSVAGAIEVPYALLKLSQSEQYDFLVALACVIKGDTPHFDYVCKMVQEGVLEVMLEDEGIPIGFGVLTVNDIEQAKSRVHVGGEAVLAGLELAML